MSNEIAKVKDDGGAIMHAVLVKGDLAKLTESERTQYYTGVCKSVGLNPFTKPFEYITLNGKLTLYARKDATEQLRQNHKVSVKIVSREMVDDCLVVTAQASTPDGRVDESIGAVAVGALKGVDKANALMKAETKAKRRVTLSICGLGIPDESEIGDISYEAQNFGPKVFGNAALRNKFVENAINSYRGAQTTAELSERKALDEDKLRQMETGSEADQQAFEELKKQFQIAYGILSRQEKMLRNADNGNFEVTEEDEGNNE